VADELVDWLMWALVIAIGMTGVAVVIAAAAGWIGTGERCEDGWVWVKGDPQPRPVMIGKQVYIVVDYPDAKCMEVLGG
jgi:hypothetical protein